MWRRYMADSTNLEYILTLEELSALTRLAILIARATTADVEVPAGSSLSSRAVSEDEED